MFVCWCELTGCTAIGLALCISKHFFFIRFKEFLSQKHRFLAWKKKLCALSQPHIIKVNHNCFFPLLAGIHNKGLISLVSTEFPIKNTMGSNQRKTLWYVFSFTVTPGSLDTNGDFHVIKVFFPSLRKQERNWLCFWTRNFNYSMK